MKSEYYGGLVPVKSRCGVGMSFHLNFQRKGEKNERQESEKEGLHKQSEETEYKIHMTGLVILNARAGCVFAGVTHWFFY